MASNLLTSVSGQFDVLGSSSRGDGSTTSDYYGGAGYGNIGLVLVNVTAVSGRPTLTVKVQHSTDSTVTWNDLAGAERTVDPAESFILNYSLPYDDVHPHHFRVVATVGGHATPTVTFDVSVVALGTNSAP